MDSTSGTGNTIKYVLIALVVLIIVGVAIFFGVNYLSQPALPPTQSTNTPRTPTTPVTPTNPTTPTTPVVTPPASTPAKDDDFVPTQGGVSDGVVTSICGGDSDKAGIGDSDGTCKRCTNVNGTDGYCEPEDDEIIQVIGCAEKTGVDCDLELDESAIIDSVDTGEVYVSDYVEDACTIKLRVVSTDDVKDLSDTDAKQAKVEPIDYVVYQSDDCSEIEFDFTGLDFEGVDDPESFPASIPLLQCGDTCLVSNQCATGSGCAQGKCAPNSCIQNGRNICDGGGCKLPNTAIFSNEVDFILLGSLIIIIGLFIWRFDLHKELFLEFGGRELLATDSELKLIERQRVVAKAKKERDSFADQVLGE